MEPLGGVSQAGEGNSISSNRKRSFSRVVPEQGKKRVNYGKGDARRIMEEAVSLCEAMSLGYEVVLHGRRRSSAAHRSDSGFTVGLRYAQLVRRELGYAVRFVLRTSCFPPQFFIKPCEGGLSHAHPIFYFCQTYGESQPTVSRISWSLGEDPHTQDAT